jgi:hypothetical protein
LWIGRHASGLQLVLSKSGQPLQRVNRQEAHPSDECRENARSSSRDGFLNILPGSSKPRLDRRCEITSHVIVPGCVWDNQHDSNDASSAAQQLAHHTLHSYAFGQLRPALQQLYQMRSSQGCDKKQRNKPRNAPFRSHWMRLNNGFSSGKVGLADVSERGSSPKG